MDSVTVSRTAPRTDADPVFQILPPESPLEMPVQRLDRDLTGGASVPFGDGVAWRRGVLLGATAGSTLGATAIMAGILAPGGILLSDAVFLLLFAVLFAWVAFAMVSALAGFIELWRAPRSEPWRAEPIIFTRTALLMPTYNEDPGRILSGIQAIYEDLDDKGVAELYDFYILSDTQVPAIARAEAEGVLRLRARLGAKALYYRRRALNLDRKAGNIADWVRRFGSAYESMIVLDADSLMSGATIVRLTSAMERDPKAGLIQTLPTIVGAKTLFARLQQFAGKVYGPVVAQGQAWWSGAESNYWGHNAILRTRAFASSAGLPHLEGGQPFGGHIMSHDFVEAALMRRGGWAVRMSPTLTGSLEETPPSLIDMAVRDRRWCQGNLQHALVVPARGLHWVSRLHLVRGMLAYLTAPLWLIFLAVGDVVWAQQRASVDEMHAPLAGALLWLTIAMLLLPKLMGAALIARDRASLQDCGGAVRLWLGVVVEIVFSALMAPVFMLMHSHAVIEVLLGSHSGWATQRRDNGRLSLKAAWSRHWAHTLAGVLWAGIAVWLDPALLAWTSPVTIGLVLAAPISVLTSSFALGQAAHRVGLFLTPEETRPPSVMVRALQLRGAYESEAFSRAQIDRLFRSASALWTPAFPWMRLWGYAAEDRKGRVR